MNLYKLTSCILSVLLVANLKPCTGIRIKTRNRSVIYARTLEFGLSLESQVLYVPKGHKYTGATPNIKPKNNNIQLTGLEWESKYSILGANAFGIDELVDGFNEKGLAGGLFYFTDYAGYQDVSQDELNISIGSWQLLTYLLTTSANISEAKNNLNKIKVSKAVFEKWGSIIPIHVILHEPTGKSLVIEYVNGELKTYDNALGVLTNSPEFSWHLTNIKNYVNLSSINSPGLNLSGKRFMPLGQGSGLLGIPGDFTPPSRFIRAVFYTQNLVQPNTALDGIYSAFNLLSLFNISKGLVRSREGKLNITEWTAASDLKNKIYYFTTYNNKQPRKVELKKLMQNNSKLTMLSMQQKPVIVDITPIKPKI